MQIYLNFLFIFAISKFLQASQLLVTALNELKLLCEPINSEFVYISVDFSCHFDQFIVLRCPFLCC